MDWRTRASLLPLVLFVASVAGNMVARCPEEWVHRPGTDQCFRFHAWGARTFRGARDYCRLYGGQLVSIEDSNTRDWMAIEVVETEGIDKHAHVWVGARKMDTEWVWDESEDVIQSGILQWENGGDDKADCAAFTENGKLIKTDCFSKLHFVCHRNMNMPLRCDFNNGWEDVQEHCYKSKYHPNGFNDALVQCALDDAHLVVIDDAAENQFIFDVAHRDYESVWIGLTEETHPGNYTWVYPQDSNYTNWSPDAITNLDGFGAAVVSKYNEGKWTAEKISESLNYVCEKPRGTCATGWKEFEGHCYYFNTEAVDEVTWETANATCSSVGAYLVIVGSNSENAFIRTTMAETDTLWLGLRSVPHDSFYWVDGTTPTNFTLMDNDVEHQALNSDDNKCSYIYTSEHDHTVSEWMAADCEETRHYVCEVGIDDPITMIPPQDGYYCPEDWSEYRGHCYRFGSDEESWTTARSKCQNWGGDLASITTWQEQDFIHLGTVDDSWIGLNDRENEDHYAWSDGTKVTFYNWNYGEPSGSKENCVELKYSNGKWNDLTCSFKKAYICKRHASATSLVPATPSPTPPGSKNCGWNWIENSITGECYRLYTDQQLSFQDANDLCKGLDYHSEFPSTLVTINTAEEALFIQTHLTSQHISNPTLWIGLQNDKSGGMRWVDGSPALYENWKSNEPNEYYRENCIEMDTGDYKWNDATCSYRRGFICEKKGDAYVKPTPFPRPNVRCPDGWKAWGDYCYLFPKTTGSWDTAHRYCQSHYGSILASIKTAEENEFIFQTMKGVSSYYNTWIGLHDDNKGGNWHWVDDTDVLYYENWAPNEPNNHNSGEHCGEMKTTSSSDGKWMDISCYTYNYYVCKITVRTCPEGWKYDNKKCYYASNYPDTWSGAQDHCREMNTVAELVSIHSYAENNLIRGMLNSGTAASWVGLTYQSDAWKWSDGSDASFLNWNIGEPNNMDDDEFCVEMIQTSGYWNNHQCGQSRNFVCEVIPTHVIGCESQWEYFGDYCYYFNYHSNNMVTKTFEDAQKECVKLDANLASIHSLEEDDFVYSLLQGYYSYTGIWIGLRNEMGQGYSWMDKTPVTYTIWDTEFSNNHKPCTYFSSSTKNNRWDKDVCTNQKYYFCKKPAVTQSVDDIDESCEEGDVPYKGSCFTIPEKEYNWKDAKWACGQLKGHLAVIDDRFEGSILSSLLIKLKGTAWIGLSGNPSGGGMDFSWVTGDKVQFTNWAEDEPETSQGSCVSASWKDSGLWSVDDCMTKHRYVCEYDRKGYTTLPPSTTTPEPMYCRDGWERHVGKCYKLFKDPVAWEKGEEQCAGYGGHLTSIGSVQEQNFLKYLDGVSSIDSRLVAIWVGLSMQSDEEGYQWSDNSALSHLNWAYGQPDSHNGRERCVAVNKLSFQYADYSCESYKPFICKIPEGLVDITTVAPVTPTPDVFCDDDSSWLLYKDHCYKIYFASEIATSWAEARRLCADEGSDLVSIHTYEENYWILSKTFKKPDRMLWTGGRAFYDSGFSWVDGSPFDFINWEVDEPNNYHDQEDCMSFYSFDNGYWNDLNCGVSLGRICKRPHGSTKPPPPPTSPPAGQCPQGWVRLRGKCHYFSGVNVTASFDTARSTCQVLNPKSDLVSIHSEAESGFMSLLAGPDTSNVWIGLRKEAETFVWTDNSPVDFTYWAFGEPSSDNGGWSYEECVDVTDWNGAWNDDSCYLNFPYICTAPVDSSISTPAPVPMCDEPYDLYESLADSCYRFITEPKTWQEAEDACVADGAHLVSVQDLGTNSYLWSVMQNLELTEETWIGLNSIKSKDEFSWTDGWPTVFTLWRNWEPNVTAEGQRCTSISPEDGRWKVQSCNDSRSFFCMHSETLPPTPDTPVDGKCPDSRWKDLGGGFCYLVVNEQMSWSDANWHCMEEYSNLVSIHSDHERDLLLKSISDLKEPIWIGLTQRGEDFGWTDGTAMDFVDWDVGEPNNQGEKCAEMYIQRGTWNDATCTTVKPFVCKTPKIVESVPDTPPTSPVKTTPTVPIWRPDGLGAGGIVGIVIACLFVVVAAGFLAHQYMNKPKPIGSNSSFGIDNALFSARDGGAHVTMTPKIDLATST
ncbi:macrophage mannose receptor 1-like isoform X2 [Oratosquilla oratoria]|uniref:macrophage mannose receptor 1-like isoform X2 n=1 Tax=Oratosquilla oratoria TaxID=337810 RepID=UPI003F75BFD7